MSSVFYAFAVGVVDLCPASDAGCIEMAKMIIGPYVFIFFNQLVPFGPGAYDMHLASKDIDELGNFIDACSAHDFTPRKDARIVFLCVVIKVVDVGAHRPKLIAGKRFTVFSDARLSIQDRAVGGFFFDSICRVEHDGSGEEGKGDGDEVVDDALLEILPWGKRADGVEIIDV